LLRAVFVRDECGEKMIFAFLLVLITTAGGFAVSYIFDEDAPLIVRVAAGSVIGTALVGLNGFLLALGFGFNLTTISIAAVLGALPLLIFRRENIRRRLNRDISLFKQQSREFFTNFDLSRLIITFSYGGLFVMLWLFFERAMLETNGGIGTGAINNLGDLPFHLLVINGFIHGQNFPPDNPIYAGAAFTYSFITDLVAAMMTSGGASIRNAMFCQNMVLIVALIILFARFTYKLTNNKTAALIAPFLLLFNGGLGFLLYFSDAIAGEAGVLGHIFTLTNDYTIRGGTIWRWGNSLTILFTTQRTLLLGLPLALIILTKIRDIFDDECREAKTREHNKDGTSGDLTAISTSPPHFLSKDRLSALVIGIFAGMLPLVHAHTFAVVMGICGLLALMSWRKWRIWAVFFVSAALVAVPELLLATTGSANAAQSFVGWKFGWDNGEENAFRFWFVNTGLFIPLLIAAIAFLAVQSSKLKVQSSESEFSSSDELDSPRHLLMFYAPFVLCFIVPNLVRLAPWVWDNIKVLIYWYIASIPLVAWLLAQLWQRSKVAFYLVPALIITLTFAGWLDVWRTATRQVEHQILSPSMIAVAADLREKTAPRSLILTAPEYASVPVLTGRRWFLGYIGHVWSHGIAPHDREQIAKKIYAGGDEAKRLIEENKIDYVLIGTAERKFAAVNDAFFHAFPLIAENGEFRVYQVSR
jgi:hypothetical protein